MPDATHQPPVPHAAFPLLSTTASGARSTTAVSSQHATVSRRARQRRAQSSDALAVLLTLASGATDAVAFLGLGGVFTANMTGNLVLLGLSVTRPEQGEILRCALAVLGFTLGLFVAFRLLSSRSAAADSDASPHKSRAASSRRSHARHRDTGALLACLLLQLVFLAGWLVTGHQPHGGAVLGLVLVSATAMGIQTALGRRLATGGITTTFVTGTLTSLTEGVALGRREHRGRRSYVLLALGAGALLAGAFLRWAPLGAVLLAPICLAAAAVVHVGDRVRSTREVGSARETPMVGE